MLMHAFFCSLIFICNFLQLIGSPTGTLSGLNFPTFPAYLHAQVRQETSEQYIPLPASRNHIPTQETHLYGNQEVLDEKGYVQAVDNSPSKMSNFRDTENDHHSISRQIEGTSNILDFPVENLYDRTAHQRGIYAGRSISACPQIGSERNEYHNNAKSKHQLAKAYMECVKRLYFGAEPLPPQIFDLPTESKRKKIDFEKLQQAMMGRSSF